MLWCWGMILYMSLNLRITQFISPSKINCIPSPRSYLSQFFPDILEAELATSEDNELNQKVEFLRVRKICKRTFTSVDLHISQVCYQKLLIKHVFWKLKRKYSFLMKFTKIMVFCCQCIGTWNRSQLGFISKIAKCTPPEELATKQEELDLPLLVRSLSPTGWSVTFRHFFRPACGTGNHLLLPLLVQSVSLVRWINGGGHTWDVNQGWEIKPWNNPLVT
jgi:hypothetical protein